MGAGQSVPISPQVRQSDGLVPRRDRQGARCLCENLPSPCNRRNRETFHCATPCSLNSVLLFSGRQVRENVPNGFPLRLTTSPAPRTQTADNASSPDTSAHPRQV